MTSVLNPIIISILPGKLEVGHPHPSSDYSSFQDIDLLYSELEGTARYAGIFLNPAEVFFWAKTDLYYADLGLKQAQDLRFILIMHWCENAGKHCLFKFIFALTSSEFDGVDD